MQKFLSPDDAPSSGNAASATAITPLLQIHRVTIIDSLRGIALLGILLMNIPFFGMPFQVAENLNIRNEYSGVNYYTWWIVNTFFEGTMRGLFSILFGAGTLLLLNRLEERSAERNPADIYYRRLIWLLIFGLINAFIFLWPGDILYSYAICGLFLFPFRKLKPKYLLMFALCFLIFFTIKGTLQWYDAKETRVNGEKAYALEKKKVKLTAEQEEDKGKWMGMQERLKTENIKKEVAKEVRKMQGGYFDIMKHLKTINVKIESSVFYNFYFYDVMLFLFIGMALFKWGVLTGECSSKLYLGMMLSGYVLGIGLAYWMNKNIIATQFNPTLILDKMPVNLYQFKRLFLTFGHIGLVMLIYKHHIADILLKWLSRVGQMAFSNYLMQSIFCVIIFYGFGFRWFGYMERHQLYYVVGSVWLFQIIFSNIWLKYFNFGPFEWLWRSLTYWKKQPFKRPV